mmetsp:Transcript_51199/g.153808  ORF Transcript_51199/g.153808 Transcript_51199/m.153808 type:complete len:86 (-) Transcript_51199:1335-1592(-)
MNIKVHDFILWGARSGLQAPKEEKKSSESLTFSLVALSFGALPLEGALMKGFVGVIVLGAFIELGALIEEEDDRGAVAPPPPPPP